MAGAVEQPLAISLTVMPTTPLCSAIRVSSPCVKQYCFSSASGFPVARVQMRVCEFSVLSQAVTLSWRTLPPPQLACIPACDPGACSRCVDVPRAQLPPSTPFQLSLPALPPQHMPCPPRCLFGERTL